VDYDKDKAIVTATGHVEAWQNGHVMRADKITFDRNTGVAAATGHVVLLDPEGGVEHLPLMSKYEVAERLLDRVAALLSQCAPGQARRVPRRASPVPSH